MTDTPVKLIEPSMPIHNSNMASVCALVAVECQSALRALTCGMYKDDIFTLLMPPELTQSGLDILDTHALKFGAVVD